MYIAPINFYSVGLVTLVLSGMATALMSKEGIRTTLKNLVAGLCAGGVIYIVLYYLGLSKGLVLLFSSLMSGFVTKFWTAIGDLLIKLTVGWIKNKMNQYPIEQISKSDKNAD